MFLSKFNENVQASLYCRDMLKFEMNLILFKNTGEGVFKMNQFNHAERQLLTTKDLMPILTSHLLEHFQWSEHEFLSYIENSHLHFYNCPQAALMTYLNISPFEESKSAYERITDLPLENISSEGGFTVWMDQVFKEITSDFGEILEIDGKPYYVIFKDSI